MPQRPKCYLCERGPAFWVICGLCLILESRADGVMWWPNATRDMSPVSGTTLKQARAYYQAHRRQYEREAEGGLDHEDWEI